MVSERIFEIGFNKCGTRSLSYLMRKLGYTARHWHKGEIALSIKKAFDENTVPLTEYEDINFLSDMVYAMPDKIIEAYKYFEFLHLHFPDAKFILNIRNVEDWIKSRYNHGNGSTMTKYKQFFNFQTDQEVIDFWRKDWDDHHNKVKAFFKEIGKEDNLLEFDIDNPDFDSLGKFLGKTVREDYWQQKGKTENSVDVLSR